MLHAGQANGERIVVIGVGNEFRGDDASGLAVARLLRATAGEEVVVCEHCREGMTMVDLWNRNDTVYLIDAVFLASRPGFIHRVDVACDPLSDVPYRHSTHSISIADAIEIARALDKLPRKLIFYGIEGKNFSLGEECSPEVLRAIPDVANAIEREISGILRTALPA